MKVLETGAKRIAVISVPQSRALVATSDGKILRRRLNTDGTPENVPLYPHEIQQRQAYFRITDPSSQPVGEACLDDLDPLERERLRSIILKQHGEQGLLSLSDEGLDGALGLTTLTGGSRYPTLAGLLLMDKLSDALDEKQKRNRIANLLFEMSHKDKTIVATGPRKFAVWRLRGKGE